MSAAALMSEVAGLDNRMADACISVLGSMLADPECIGPMVNELSDDDFVWPAYKAVFQFIRHLFREGRPVDIVTVTDGLRTSGVDIGTFAQQLYALTPTSANVREYAALLRELATLWRLRDMGFRLTQAKTLDECRALLDEATGWLVERRGVRGRTFAELYQEFYDRHDGETAQPYFPWPLDALNKDIQFRPGHIGFLGAYPGVGKTALAMQAAAKFAERGAVGYYSYESTAGELYDRHVARTALVDSLRIRDNRMTEEDYNEVYALRRQMTEPQVELIPAAGMTVDDITTYAMSRRHALIIVDYIQHVPSAAKGRRWPETEYERVSNVSMALQSFAARTGAAVLALSQLSRPQKITRRERTADGVQARTFMPPPTMSSLRSSGQQEQDADFILLLWREDDDDPASARRLQIAKNRHGPSGGGMRLAFDGAHQLFSPLTAREEREARGTRRAPAQARPAVSGQVDMLAVDDDSDLPF